MSHPNPSLGAQIDALCIAFIELSKMLGRTNHLAVNQLAAAIETAAKASGAGQETEAAASELARRLR